jgi:CBS domain containing-hemolysin-like protein
MQKLFSLPLTLLILFTLALISFLFSASETAVIGLSKIRLRHMLARKVRRAQAVQNLVTHSDKFITTILIGNNFVNIAISAIITGIFVYKFGYRLGVFTSTLVAAFFVLVFCEITPKLLATKHTERTALFSAPIMEALMKLLKPVVVVFIGISNLILKVFGIGAAARSPLVTEEELRLMIEVGREEGVLSDEERRMLHRIFEFGDIKVRDVMVPKEKIVAVNINTTSEELLNIFVEQGHARLPVYSGAIENIVGVIYARDLLYILKNKGLFLLQDLIQGACYVAPGLKVNELLRRFQAEKIQMAVVADENKKTLGLVTLEDLLEEIVGEIEEKRPPRKSK